MNYMWKRDPSLWASSAPILFPIVGALRNNECTIDGKKYTMTQHGFSRHNLYKVNQINDTCVEFILEPNEDILKQHIENCEDDNQLYYLNRVPRTHLSYEQANSFLIEISTSISIAANTLFKNSRIIFFDFR